MNKTQQGKFAFTTLTASCQKKNVNTFLLGQWENLDLSLDRFRAEGYSTNLLFNEVKRASCLQEKISSFSKIKKVSFCNIFAISGTKSIFFFESLGSVAHRKKGWFLAWKFIWDILRDFQTLWLWTNDLLKSLKKLLFYTFVPAIMLLWSHLYPFLAFPWHLLSITLHTKKVTNFDGTPLRLWNGKWGHV